MALAWYQPYQPLSALILKFWLLMCPLGTSIKFDSKNINISAYINRIHLERGRDYEKLKYKVLKSIKKLFSRWK